MGFELSASLRRIKPQRRRTLLKPRPDAALRFAENQPSKGRELLLDTSVYVDVLQGRVPAHVGLLFGERLTNHSTVALAELTHLLGALDPDHPGTSRIVREITITIDDMPPRRLSAPSPRAFAEAGMLSGLVTRLTGQPRTTALLNDALLFVQAIESGFDLLTGNVRDFDWFDQLMPGSGVMLYRAV